jgi:hypothetical protein
MNFCAERAATVEVLVQAVRLVSIAREFENLFPGKLRAF